MHEHDRLFPLHVGAVDLLLFMDRENCHVILLWVCRLGQSVRFSRSMHLARTPDDQSRSFCIDFGTLENVLVVCQHLCYHQGMKSEEASGVTGPFPKPSSIRVDPHGAYPTSVSGLTILSRAKPTLRSVMSYHELCFSCERCKRCFSALS